MLTMITIFQARFHTPTYFLIDKAPTFDHCAKALGLVLFDTKAHKQPSWAEHEFSIELRKYFANNN